MAKQFSFLPAQIKDHGGALAVGRRRARRPLDTKLALHLTLKSHHAVHGRELTRHKSLIEGVAEKYARRFDVTVYRMAICATHLHLAIRGRHRRGLQNFFRVFAGQVAQQILLRTNRPPRAGEEKCRKNQRTFWGYLIYSRVVTWGREFRRIMKYLEKNILESLYLIAYAPRPRRSSA